MGNGQWLERKLESKIYVFPWQKLYFVFLPFNCIASDRSFLLPGMPAALQVELLPLGCGKSAMIFYFAPILPLWICPFGFVP